MNETQKTYIVYALHMAFEYGRWLWQVDLEEHMDNSSYFDAFLGVLHDKKTAMPLHTVASSDLSSIPVRYNLRSDIWREGVKKNTKESLEKEIEKLFERISLPIIK